MMELEMELDKSSPDSPSEEARVILDKLGINTTPPKTQVFNRYQRDSKSTPPILYGNVRRSESSDVVIHRRRPYFEAESDSDGINLSQQQNLSYFGFQSNFQRVNRNVQGIDRDTETGTQEFFDPLESPLHKRKDGNHIGRTDIYLPKKALCASKDDYFSAKCKEQSAKNFGKSFNSSKHTRVKKQKSTYISILIWLFKLFCMILLLFFLLAVSVALFDIIRNESCKQEHNQNIDVARLSNLLRTSLFGQHLADDLIHQRLVAFMNQRHKLTPLVLYFYGWTGTGKTFTSDLLKQVMPSDDRTQQVIVPVHLPADTHISYVFPQVLEHLSLCGLNYVIFDEIDLATDNMIDAILDLIKQTHGMDEPRYEVIFTLISNQGSLNITNSLLSHIQKGYTRGAITVDEVLEGSQDIHRELYILQKLKNEGIDITLVPFLPLQREQVEQCAAVALWKKGLPATKVHVSKVVNEMIFYPPDYPIFSKTGCKKVTSKLDLVFTDWTD